MRLFSYILTALVTIFVFNVALSFSLPAYRDVLVRVRTNVFPVSEKVPNNQIAEEKKSENARLVESLDRIDKHIESLGEAKNTGVFVSSGTVGSETGVVNTVSGMVIPEEEDVLKEPDIPIS